MSKVRSEPIPARSATARAFESVVVQGVQLHRFGALTPRQRAELDALIESRDRFEGLFRKQAMAAKRAGLLADLDVFIAVKTIPGGLQWSLIWYRPRAGDSDAARQRLASAMVDTLLLGLPARAQVCAKTTGARKLSRMR